MKVVIPVSDKYQYIIPVFCELFNKYWKNQECIILCFNKIPIKLPSNFEIISLGKDSGYWTTNLRKFFSCFKDEYFVMHLEDHFLFEYVKLDELKIMENEIKNGADKAMLHAHLNVYSAPFHDNVLLINQDSEYRTSIHTAIWKTDYFMKYLNTNTSVWGFETVNSKNDGAKIVSIKSENTYHDHIVNFINLLRSGKIDPSIVGLWHEEDLDILLKLPLDEENKQVLIRRTKNDCPVCKKKVDRMLIKERDVMRKYESFGICALCQ